METDYISREAAIELLELAINDSWEPSYAAERMREVPAADVRPVVYCKDCKWYRESELLAPNRFCFRLKGKDGKPVGYNFSDMDFCSYGKRREGGTP